MPIRPRTPRPARARWAPALAALAALALAPNAAAQPPGAETSPRPIALSSVLETAVRDSPALELARIDVAIAEAAVLEAAGIDDWLVGATGRWSSFRSDPVEGNPLQTTSRDQFALEADVTRLLPSGGTLSLHGLGSYTESTFVVEDGPGGAGGFGESESDEWIGSVTGRLSHPLLRGRGYAIARADRRFADVDRSVAALQERATATQVVRDIIQGYWELAYAVRDLEIRESSLKLARERLRNTEAGIEAGSVAPSEALAVEQAIATRMQEIEQAELNVTRRSLELRRLAGLEIGPDEINLAVAAPLEVVEREMALRELLARARRTSPEIAVLREAGKGAEIEVELTENGLLPRLDAAISFGPRGVSSDADDALSQMISFDSYEVGATLTYEQALGNSAARGAHAGARRRLRRTKIDIAEAQLQVSAAVVGSVHAAETADDRMDIGQRAIQLAEENIEVEKARFELGRATNFDVLQRQEEFKQAQLRYARAAVDYLAALARIDALTGDLLDRYGITIEDR